MHVKVQEFLAEDVGYRRSFAITGERPSFDGLKLTKDIDGELTISRLDDGLLVDGTVTTELELVCDRCLRSFTRPVRLGFEAVYRDHPEDDEWPIDHDSIDLAPLIEQELIVSQPIKQLDRPDCPGIATTATSEADSAPSMRVGDRARITKG
jgi:DUF177 domain-containing protein